MSDISLSYPPLLRPLAHMDMHSLRAGFLFMALVLYAFLGSPTPDYPGWVEAVIAGLLVMAVGMPDALGTLRLDFKAPLWQAAGQLLLIYGLCIGVLMGLMQGQSLALMVRDVAPFLFMLLPVFMVGLCRAYPAVFKYLIAGVCVIGAVFAVRALGDVGLSVLALFMPSVKGELMYLANAPTLLFTAMACFGFGLERFMCKFSVGAALRFLFLSALAVLILVPVALTTQRASLGYVALFGAIVSAGLFYKYPQRMAVVILSALVLSVPFYGVIVTLVEALMQKTALVGVNARFAEVAAVWREISKSADTLFFGKGWGGTFESPAVAEIRVNFTHSLLSSMLLKLGIGGVILVILYLFGLLRALIKVARLNPILALALAGPVAIDVFLYASFKSLDFGLVLLMIPAFLIYREQEGGQVAKPRALLYSKEVASY